MMFGKPLTDFAAAAERPRIVRLRHNLIGVVFSLMKLLPARFILDRAEQEGLVDRRSVIVETSSGTFALALAMHSAIRGYRCILVSDPAVDSGLATRLRDLGAELELVNKPLPEGGFQAARLQRLMEVQAREPHHFWPRQYENAANPNAYAPVAEALIEEVGTVDCLVGPVGSGGSMCGVSSYLRTVFSEMHCLGVDTHASVIFGQPDGPRALRGLGNSLMPKNVDHTVFDEVHWVSAAEAFAMTRQVHRRHALFQGPTSGASYLAARWWAEQNPDANVVCMMPDEGFRYLETVYNDSWIRENRLWLDVPPAVPLLVADPAQALDVWSRFVWGRRSYDEVMDHPFTPGVPS